MRMLEAAVIALSLCLLTACTNPAPPPTPAAPSPTLAGPPAPTPGTPGLAVLYGGVQIDDAPAPAGTILTLQVNGNNCGSAILREAGRYEVVVASDAEKRGCGKPGDAVTVLLGGAGEPGSKQFDQKASFRAASQVLDLTLKTR